MLSYGSSLSSEIYIQYYDLRGIHYNGWLTTPKGKSPTAESLTTIRFHSFEKLAQDQEYNLDSAQTAQSDKQGHGL